MTTAQHSLFSLAYTFNEDSALLDLQVPQHLAHTTHYTKTRDYLLENFPQVLSTRCFNELNLPFTEEVKQTEMGHLFEHILLTYLCEEKVLAKKCCEEIKYRGETQWDWRNNKVGTFVITIDIPQKESDLFEKALAKTCELFKKLIQALLPQNNQTTELSLVAW